MERRICMIHLEGVDGGGSLQQVVCYRIFDKTWELILEELRER